MRYLLLLLILLNFNLFSTEDLIHGNVYGLDNNGNEVELPGVRVWWLGTEIGGYSDSGGHFMFPIPEKSRTLVFQMLGYPNDTLIVEDTGQFIFHTLKNYDAGEVVVEDKLPNRIISRSSIENKETITGTQLGKLACCNLSEAFESDPSVNVEYTDPVSGTKQMKLMGLHGKYSQVMIEKIPFIRALNIPFGLSYLPGPWIESISISKGAADVSTGFESTTGQINIELKKPEDFEEGVVNLFYDAGNRAEINSVLNKQINDKISMINMFNANMISNMNDLNNDGIIDRPATRNINLSSKVKYDGSDVKAQAGVRFILDDRESEFSNLLVNNQLQINNTRGELFFKSGSFISDHFSLAVTGSVNWQENITNNTLNLVESEFDLSNNSAQLNILSEYNINEHNNLSSGISFLYDDFQNMILGSEIFQNNFSYFTPGAFVSYKNTAIDFANFSLGLRADYNSLNQVFLTPRANLKLKPFENLDLRLNGGRGFRYANVLAENVFLFLYDENMNNQIVVDFEQLAMESAWNYGATLNYIFDFGLKNISLGAEYFMTRFDNRVIVDQYRYDGAYSPQIIETSNAYSESYGVDLILPITSFIEISTSARVENSFFENASGDLIREPLSSIIRSVNNINYDIDPWDLSLRFTASYYGSGKRTIKSEGRSSFDDFDPFWIFGGQINKDFDELDLEVYLGFNNITSYTIFSNNTDAQAIAGNFFGSDLWGPLMGRNIYLGINWKGF
jgi:hypothetical protein